MSYERPLYDDVQEWTYQPLSRMEFLGLGRLPSKLTEGLDHRQRQVRMILSKAQRYMLSDSFTKLANEVARELDKVPTWINLARLPYPQMWVEWDQHVKVLDSWDAGMLLTKPNLAHVVQRGGILFQEVDADRGTWVCSRWEGSDKGRDAYVSDIGWVVAPEGDSHLALQPPAGYEPLSVVWDGRKSGVPNKEATRGEIEAYAMGIGKMYPHYDKLASFLENRIVTAQEPTLTVMVRNAQRNLRPDLVEPFGKEISNKVRFALEEDKGLMRFVITLIAMIVNAPNIVKDVQERQGQRHIGMHRLPYWGHNTITLKLPKTKPARFIARALDKASAEARHNRAHMCSGHWRQVEYGKRVPFKCNHVPTLVENGLGICVKCERMVRWIPAHQRGDAGLGWVTHDYVVEAS